MTTAERKAKFAGREERRYVPNLARSQREPWIAARDKVARVLGISKDAAVDAMCATILAVSDEQVKETFGEEATMKIFLYEYRVEHTDSAWLYVIPARSEKEAAEQLRDNYNIEPTMKPEHSLASAYIEFQDAQGATWHRKGAKRAGE